MERRAAKETDRIQRLPRQPARRCGLSTLEMVLSLPILLFLMALMINYGTASSWKIRGLTVARHAVWSSRWPRTLANQPRPSYWPSTATAGSDRSADAPALDDPRADLIVARGPSLPLGNQVHRELLNPARGMLVGASRIERPHTLMKSLGRYSLESRVELLDDKFSFDRTGQPANTWRRIPAIYDLAKPPARHLREYLRAVDALLRAPLRNDLFPLDRDDEFIGYSLRFGWGTGASEFYPPLAQFCDLDKTEAGRRAQNLVDHIQGKEEPRLPSVAEVMAQAFIDLYSRAIDSLREQAKTLPSGSTGPISAEIGQLQGKIGVLRRFLDSLRTPGK